MIHLVACVQINSEKNLEEVASLVSQNLLGGVPFVGKDEYIYDEVPAIYAKRHVLGLRVILQGYGGEDGYLLEILPKVFQTDGEMSGENVTVDITEFIICALSEVEGIRTQKPD